MNENETGILDPRHRLRQKTPAQIERDKALRRRELNDLAKVLETKEGRRFFWHLLSVCKTFDGAMTGNSNTFYILGMQDLGKKFYRDAHLASLKLYRIAEDEAAAERDEETVAQEKGED